MQGRHLASEPQCYELERAEFETIGNLVRLCGCTNDEFEFDPENISDIRDFSNTFMADGTAPSTLSLTNLVWAWGQFLDHILVATVDDEEGEEFDIVLTAPGEQPATMTLGRVIVDEDPETMCRMPRVTTRPLVDAGTVYGPDEEFLQRTLRAPHSCRLRTSEGDFLPVTAEADGSGQHRFIAGDNRVDEHSVLASMHTIFVREHNRLCDVMDADRSFSGLSVDEKFEKARAVRPSHLP